MNHMLIDLMILFLIRHLKTFSRKNNEDLAARLERVEGFLKGRLTGLATL